MEIKKLENKHSSLLTQIELGEKTHLEHQKNLEHINTTLKNLYQQQSLTQTNRARIAKLRVQRRNLMQSLGCY